MLILRALAAAGVLAVAPAFIPAAEAQWGAPTDLGYNEGYTRGQRAGLEDARRGDRYEFQDESDYRRGDAGYRSQYGSREWYRDSFRRGFEAGYRDGYNVPGYGAPGYGAPGYGAPGYGAPGYGVPRRVPPPGSNGRGAWTTDVAYERGFNDGYEAGLSDGRARRRFDPVSEGRYRSADRGYDRRFGSRDAYKIRYRDAFRSGYERGFQDGRRYSDRRPLGGFLGFLF